MVMDELVQVLVAGMVAALTIAGVILGVMRIERAYDRNVCLGFAAESAYETKFVDYSFFGWDCLAKAGNGKWVSADNLRAND